MSIAAISPSFASAAARSAAPVAVDAAAPAGSTPRAQREHGAGRELVDALKQALGVQGRGDDPAIHHFAHALMQDLRTLAGDSGEGARAWGRQEWGGLQERVSTLATAAAATPPAPDVPDQPNPVTTATMAVHIMKVPSSHLLSAFVAMQRALMQQGQQDSAQQHDSRAALAELAQRIAGALAPSAPTA